MDQILQDLFTRELAPTYPFTKPDGECWLQAGLTPDILVSRTIQGIKEGRDELMEAVVAYLLEHKE